MCICDNIRVVSTEIPNISLLRSKPRLELHSVFHSSPMTHNGTHHIQLNGLKYDLKTC